MMSLWESAIQPSLVTVGGPSPLQLLSRLRTVLAVMIALFLRLCFGKACCRGDLVGSNAQKPLRLPALRGKYVPYHSDYYGVSPWTTCWIHPGGGGFIVVIDLHGSVRHGGSLNWGCLAIALGGSPPGAAGWALWTPGRWLDLPLQHREITACNGRWIAEVVGRVLLSGPLSHTALRAKCGGRCPGEFRGGRRIPPSARTA